MVDSSVIMPKRSHSYYKGRKCCRCITDLSEKEHGRREYDHKGDWTGRWLCNTCNSKDYNDGPNSYKNQKKSVAAYRTNNLSLCTNCGKGFIGEAIVAKIRKLEILAIKMDNFHPLGYDLSPDIKYNRIQIKLAGLIEGYWTVRFGMYHEFDNLFVLCTDKDTTIIKRVYIISEDELYGIGCIRLPKDPCIYRGSKYDKFRIDEEPYNDAYHSLMEFLKDKKYFGIKDIKKWLEEN